MSDKDANKGNQNVGERGYRNPGLRGVRTTTLFRAVNPELFIKPVRILVYVASMANTFCIFYFGKCAPNRLPLQNKPVMAFGLVTITLCVAYLGYMHAMKENDQQLYEAIDSDGERYTRRKSSKWD